MDDAFNAALTLLSAAADARGCKSRLKKLRLQEKHATAALAKLEIAREKHTATKAELAAKEAALVERERVLADWEQEARLRGEKERFPFDANFLPGTRSHTGMARHDGNS
jgi:hypothetical protein